MELQSQEQFTCVGCGELILDQYVLRVAPDMEWHARCLRCTDCQQLLDETCTCFVRNGCVYCKPDYIRLFGTRCAKCHERFARNDLVMRARSHIFHVDCFRCHVCARQLVAGDQFALREDDARLLCKADHEAAYVINNKNNGQANAPDELDSVIDDVIVSCATNNNNDVDTKTASDTSSSRSETASPTLVLGVSTTSCSSDAASSRPARSSTVNHGTASSYHHRTGRAGGRSSSGHRGGGGVENKTTRIRTVLNEKQLHTLRTCYSANSRPDALMKEQLVEMTGLSPRVIRVWFQNKRCKDKKRSLALKQLHQQQQNKGVPLIATSPVRHELPQNMQPTPVEVHKFAAPWNDVLGDSCSLVDCSRSTHPPTLLGSCSPTSAGGDMDDVPSPRGLLCSALPVQVGLLTESDQQAMMVAAAAVSHHHQLSCESFADSLDDDTVVSFDDLPDVTTAATTTAAAAATGLHCYVASAPPPLTDNHSDSASYPWRDEMPSRADG